MDYVMRKRYQGKIEHHEVDLHDALLTLCRADRLAVLPSPLVQPPEGSFTMGGERLLAVLPSPVVQQLGEASSVVILTNI